MKRLFLVLFVFIIAWHLWPSGTQYQPDGVLAAAMPQQWEPDSETPFELNGYRVYPLASFGLHARVLAKKDYRSGREADLSPVDVAFGWGRMSDSAVLEQIRITQGNRWYHWKTTSSPPIPLREIEVSSANMHLIPADAGVRDAITGLREGQMVQLQGQLVRVEASDGWRWKSSLTREDTGGGACELIYVESIQVD